LKEELAYEPQRNLFEFAYDWRQDVRDSAKELAAAVEAMATSQPITIIAHSMGSLVSRYCIEHLGGKKKIGRLICIGGPHFGTPLSIVNLTQKSNYLPFGLLGERIRDVFVTFPSAYQLLPNFACATDQDGNKVSLLAHDEWLPDQYHPYLRNAREFWKELSPTVSVPAVSIFGYGLKTITGVKVHSSDGNKMEIREAQHNSNGDDTVPEWSSVLTGSEIHPVQQNHGTIYVDKDVKMRLKMELTKPAN
jgi:pimeloyl-ACP methyl ester carboxylesterase